MGGGRDTKKLLYISGSIGLGHVWRDLEIVNALRKLRPDVDVTWVSEEPALNIFRSRGEKILPEAERLINSLNIVEQDTEAFSSNMIYWSMKWLNVFPKNAEILIDAIKRERFDLVVGDESYDLITTLAFKPEKKAFPFLIIYDFVGHHAKTMSPKEHLYGWMINRFWINTLKNKPQNNDGIIFIGESEDVPDQRFGFLQPNMRKLCDSCANYVGYILPFDPKDYMDRGKVRKELGYGDGPLAVVSIGGTATAKPLLDLCAKVYPQLKEQIPDLKMVIACGPKINPSSIPPIDGLEVRGYIPELYKHFAAADISIGAGGGTTTLELMALQKPFIYFPLIGHSEQEIDVADRNDRYGAGIRMDFSKATEEDLIRTVKDNIGRTMNYPQLPLDGAQKAAKIISELL